MVHLKSQCRTFSLLLLMLLITGCVNLDERDPAPFRFGQRTNGGQTVATKASPRKSVQAMEQSAKPSGFTAMLAEAWPFRRKVQMTVQDEPLADDDPTRLDNMPKEVGSDLYIASARLAEQTGDLNKAAEQYQSVLQKDAQNRHALIGLARLNHRTGHVREAISIYQKALETHRNDPVIMNDLGICYARDGQVDQAIEMLAAATKAAPDRDMYVNNLAASLVEANRTSEAFAHLRESQADSVAHYKIGYLLNQSGRRHEAADHLQQALALNPQFRQASELLGEVRPQISSLPQSSGGVPSRWDAADQTSAAKTPEWQDTSLRNWP